MPDNRKPLIYGAFPVCRNYTVRAHVRHALGTERPRYPHTVRSDRAFKRSLHDAEIRPQRQHDQAAGHGADGLFPVIRRKRDFFGGYSEAFSEDFFQLLVAFWTFSPFSEDFQTQKKQRAFCPIRTRDKSWLLSNLLSTPGKRL